MGLRGQFAPCSSNLRWRMGHVGAYRCSGSEEIGRDRWRRNLRSSSVSTPVTAANVVRLGDSELGAIHRLMLNATSATVKGSPFDHLIPSRNLKSQVLRSSDGCQLSARYGCVTLSESTYVRNSTELRNRLEASIQVVAAGSVICWMEQ